jgi:hypothetical protein
MELVLATKEELTKAYQRWNIDVIETPQKHEASDSSLKDAESQVDEMMSHIEVGHMGEVRMVIVDSFMKHCAAEGVDIPESVLEGYFGA